MSLLAEMNSKALQALEAPRQFFVDEATGGFRRREIQNHEYMQHLQSELHQKMVNKLTQPRASAKYFETEANSR